MSGWEYITAGGSLYNLDLGYGQRWVTEVGGVAVPPITNRSAAGYRQDGETWLDYKIDPRNIDIKFYERYSDMEAMWSGNMEWIQRFAPSRSAGGTLRRILAGGTYSIPVRVNGEVDINNADSDHHFTQAYIVPFVAHDPIWRGSTDTYQTAGSAGSELAWPIAYPIWWDSGAVFGTISITYTGSWRTWPTLKVSGPVTNPTFVHDGLDAKIGLRASISIGGTIFVYVDPAGTTAEDSDGNDLSDRLTEDSDPAGFYIENGLNEISIYADGTGGTPVAYVEFENRFLGVS